MYKEISKNGVTTTISKLGRITHKYVTDQNLIFKETIDIFDAETKKRIHPKDINESMNKKIIFVDAAKLEGEETVYDDVHVDHPEYDNCFSSIIMLSDKMNGVKYESQIH